MKQTGDVIVWSDIDPVVTHIFVDIFIGKSNDRWAIVADAQSTNLRLPKIPNGITEKLLRGKNYSLYFYAAVRDDTGFELYSVQDDLWTR